MKRLTIILAAVLLAACGSATPASLSPEADSWCQQLTSAGAVLAAAKTLGVDPAKDVYVTDWHSRDGYRRACQYAWDHR